MDKGVAMKPHHARRLTLMELLVVIAILVSLQLPALRNAREMARQALCIGNQRRLALIVTRYADDFDGHVEKVRSSLPYARVMLQ